MQGAAGCVTVRVLPPIVSVAVRVVPVLFGATLKPMLALPVPFDAVESVSHAAFDPAFQAQPVTEVSATLEEMPAAGAVYDDADNA